MLLLLLLEEKLAGIHFINSFVGGKPVGTTIPQTVEQNTFPKAICRLCYPRLFDDKKGWWLSTMADLWGFGAIFGPQSQNLLLLLLVRIQ